MITKDTPEGTKVYFVNSSYDDIFSWIGHCTVNRIVDHSENPIAILSNNSQMRLSELYLTEKEVAVLCLQDYIRSLKEVQDHMTKMIATLLG